MGDEIGERRGGRSNHQRATDKEEQNIDRENNPSLWGAVRPRIGSISDLNTSKGVR